MPEPGVIADYLAALGADLPAGIIEEMADGLDQACQRYVRQGLAPEAAARAAVTEFGEPQLVVRAFASASPARRAARTLLAIGPFVGLCWGAALITGRAWAWQVPAAASGLLGVALVAVIGLLAVAAFGRRYRSATYAGVAGCAGLAALDAAMLTILVVGVPGLIWPMIMAGTASTARLLLTIRLMRPVLAR